MFLEVQVINPSPGPFQATNTLKIGIQILDFFFLNMLEGERAPIGWFIPQMPFGKARRGHFSHVGDRDTTT